MAHSSLSAPHSFPTVTTCVSSDDDDVIFVNERSHKRDVIELIMVDGAADTSDSSLDEADKENGAPAVGKLHKFSGHELNTCTVSETDKLCPKNSSSQLLLDNVHIGRSEVAELIHEEVSIAETEDTSARQSQSNKCHFVYYGKEGTSTFNEAPQIESSPQLTGGMLASQNVGKDVDTMSRCPVSCTTEQTMASTNTLSAINEKSHMENDIDAYYDGNPVKKSVSTQGSKSTGLDAITKDSNTMSGGMAVIEQILKPQEHTGKGEGDHNYAINSTISVSIVKEQISLCSVSKEKLGGSYVIEQVLDPQEHTGRGERDHNYAIDSNISVSSVKEQISLCSVPKEKLDTPESALQSKANSSESPSGNTMPEDESAVNQEQSTKTQADNTLPGTENSIDPSVLDLYEEVSFEITSEDREADAHFDDKEIIAKNHSEAAERAMQCENSNRNNDEDKFLITGEKKGEVKNLLHSNNVAKCPNDCIELVVLSEDPSESDIEMIEPKSQVMPPNGSELSLDSECQMLVENHTIRPATVAENLEGYGKLTITQEGKSSIHDCTTVSANTFTDTKPLMLNSCCESEKSSDGKTESGTALTSNEVNIIPIDKHNKSEPPIVKKVIHKVDVSSILAKIKSARNTKITPVGKEQKTTPACDKRTAFVYEDDGHYRRQSAEGRSLLSYDDLFGTSGDNSKDEEEGKDDMKSNMPQDRTKYGGEVSKISQNIMESVSVGLSILRKESDTTSSLKGKTNGNSPTLSESSAESSFKLVATSTDDNEQLAKIAPLGNPPQSEPPSKIARPSSPPLAQQPSKIARRTSSPLHSEQPSNITIPSSSPQFERPSKIASPGSPPQSEQPSKITKRTSPLQSEQPPNSTRPSSSLQSEQPSQILGHSSLLQCEPPTKMTRPISPQQSDRPSKSARTGSPPQSEQPLTIARHGSPPKSIIQESGYSSIDLANNLAKLVQEKKLSFDEAAAMLAGKQKSLPLLPTPIISAPLPTNKATSLTERLGKKLPPKESNIASRLGQKVPVEHTKPPYKQPLLPSPKTTSWDVPNTSSSSVTSRLGRKVPENQADSSNSIAPILAEVRYSNFSFLPL